MFNRGKYSFKKIFFVFQMFREFAYEKNTIEILQIPRVSRNIIYILVVEKLMDQKGHIDGHTFFLSFFFIDAQP